MIVYKCKRCGHVIYKYEYNGDSIGLFGPDDIAFQYIKCPRCGRILNENVTLDDITVKPRVLKPGKYNIYITSKQYDGHGYSLKIYFRKPKYHRNQLRTIELIVKRETPVAEVINTIYLGKKIEAKMEIG